MSNQTEEIEEFDAVQPRLDRSVINVFSSFAEAEEANRTYWFSRTPQERLRYMEQLRRMNYGRRATARLQRVLEFTSSEPR
jgi:hypothetical protein